MERLKLKDITNLSIEMLPDVGGNEGIGRLGLPAETVTVGGPVVIFENRGQDLLSFFFGIYREVSPWVGKAFETLLLLILPTGGENFGLAPATFREAGINGFA